MPSNQKLAITTKDSNDDFEPPCKRASFRYEMTKWIYLHTNLLFLLCYLMTTYIPILRCQHNIMIVLTGSNAHLQY